MASLFVPVATKIVDSQPRQRLIFRPKAQRKFLCHGKKLGPSADFESNDNLLLKVAWYGSELLGIAASIFRPSKANNVEQPWQQQQQVPELELAGPGTIPRATVAEIIKADFQRSYFVTGNLTLDIYEEDCEFADPAGSFRGLGRFKRNCSNFGYLLEKSNMKLTKWEDLEDKGIGHWRFICVMAFPWRPILSATGYTEYYFDPQSGRICRHSEHWNVPKMALLKQIFRPSRGFFGKKPDL